MSDVKITQEKVEHFQIDGAHDEDIVEIRTVMEITHKKTGQTAAWCCIIGEITAKDFCEDGATVIVHIAGVKKV
jgi:hypothetical protein